MFIKSNSNHRMTKFGEEVKQRRYRNRYGTQ